jgi:pyridoxamine 5'-phosphate oxidase
VTSWTPGELAGARISYERGTLEESALAPTPLAQFERWLEDAAQSGMPEPNAMALATVDGRGVPTSRTVLLKGVDAEGFRFFTHYGSRKARAMGENSRVSLLFAWIGLQRQVEVAGRAERMAAEESERYFRTRPRGSRLAAWVSAQSQPLADRSELEARAEEMARRWPEGAEVPMPPGWGGYLVRADSVEFWQGRVSRLHDRLRYEPEAPRMRLDATGWRVRRYWP